ncbi:hypothetical protein F5Y10DRAFT_63990 [Nemania abortiva]|nr:hypothetical protein F5Y10DRAFT_63990 [Nemania abortiva]
MLYPFTIRPSFPAPPVRRALRSQPLPVLRKSGQVEAGWRMSHSRDRLEWNLHVAMQVYRPKKRMEAQFDRRDRDVRREWPDRRPPAWLGMQARRTRLTVAAASASQDDSIAAEGDSGRGLGEVGRAGDRPESNGCGLVQVNPNQGPRHTAQGHSDPESGDTH